MRLLKAARAEAHNELSDSDYSEEEEIAEAEPEVKEVSAIDDLCCHPGQPTL